MQTIDRLRAIVADVSRSHASLSIDWAGEIASRTLTELAQVHSLALDYDPSALTLTFYIVNGHAEEYTIAIPRGIKRGKNG